MTLSNDEVRQVLNDQFICAWFNIKDDPAAGMSFSHPPGDQAMDLLRGLGEHNNQILMVTPNGKILNALAGYIGPSDLLEELHFGVNLLAKVNKASEGNRESEVTKAHKTFAEQFEVKKPANNGFFGMPDFGAGFMQTGSKRAASDHRWTAAHPLMPAKNFTTGGMVGNGKSFFAASGSGSMANFGGGGGGGGSMPNFGGGGGSGSGNPANDAMRMMDDFMRQMTGGQPRR